MKRFTEAEDRKRVTLLPDWLNDFVAEHKPFRIMEAFVEQLDLASLSCEGAIPALAIRSMVPVSSRMTVASVWPMPGTVVSRA
ncbi:hypothetical protein PQR02_06270 [Paraburkholderia sediminicola]|uniref:Uncharacterized protein n=1 Tax=Paraburkholderia rhynchosiae TaxID=487049 RepID=A0ACC7N5D5_9BURK